MSDRIPRICSRQNGLRLTAVLLAVTLVLTVLGQVTINPDVYAEGSSAAAAAKSLYNNNDYIEQNRLLRGGEAALAAVTTPRSFADFYQELEIAIAKGQYDKALQALDSCLQLADSTDRVLLGGLKLKQGCLLTLVGDDPAALQSLQEAARLDPELSDTWLVQTEILIKQQSWTLAASCLSRYLKLKPDDKRLLGAMAEILEMNGDYEQAIDYYTQSILSYDAQAADTWLRRGSCRLQIGDFSQAAVDFRQALALGADPQACQENLVLSYLLLEDYDAVLAIGADLVAPENASGELWQHLGVAALALEKPQEALDYFTRSIEKQDELAANHYYRGVSYLILEQFEQAQVDFTESIRRGEMLQLSYYNRGVCAVNLADYKQAQADLKQTLALSDDTALNQAARGLLEQLAQQ